LPGPRADRARARQACAACGAASPICPAWRRANSRQHILTTTPDPAAMDFAARKCAKHYKPNASIACIARRGTGMCRHRVRFLKRKRRSYSE
jgi:hypothetical protein